MNNFRREISFSFNNKISNSLYIIIKNLIIDLNDNNILHNMSDDIFDDLLPKGHDIHIIFKK